MHAYAHTLRVNLTLEESLVKKTASPFSVTGKDHARGWEGWWLLLLLFIMKHGLCSQVLTS